MGFEYIMETGLLKGDVLEMDRLLRETSRILLVLLLLKTDYANVKDANGSMINRIRFDR